VFVCHQLTPHLSEKENRKRTARRIRQRARLGKRGARE